MHSKKELDIRLREANVSPLKNLGQNFLVNGEICRQILKPILDAKPRAIVEIGPGLGALTDELLESQSKILLVELDRGLAQYWKTKHPELSVLNQDALHLDWAKLDLPNSRALVSNLPYSIAASIVVEMSQLEQPPFDLMVLMFQKEVAQRIQATMNDEDYGMLSVVAQGNWEIHKVVDAGPQDFFPVPNVGSRVLSFVPKKVPFDRSGFLKLVKAAFSQRRKKLSKNLSSLYSPKVIEGAFGSLGVDDNTRAQELSIDQWIQLFSLLTKA